MTTRHPIKPSLICFDLGGVIVRICRTWEEACVRAGVPLRALERLESSRGLRSAVVLDHQTGRIDDETFALRLSAALDGAYTPAEVMAVHRAWVIEEYPGVSAAIDRLHDAGLETAALSNTNPAHWEQIRQWPALRRIQRPHVSHLMGLHKPDPAIYRAFEASVGRQPEEILFFDDLQENVDAARRAGWQAVQVGEGGWNLEV